MQKAIFTIISSNYLHYARTLLQSASVHHPECKRFCVLVDDDPSHAASYPDEFAVVALDALLLPDARCFIFRYTILELNTAVKPWAFAHLFAQGFSEVVYIDPDIRLYRRLDEVFALLDGGADIVVTPHLLAPMADEKTPTELDIRRAGTYNFGFCALARSTNTDAFLTWWKAKLVEDCVVDLEAGIFVDQSWIDLVPGLFPNVSILRHPGYNVAYWNLAQRPLAHGDRGWTANAEPLVFFHFSGFNAESPEAFSKHQNRFTLGTLGAAGALVNEYAALLLGNGARTMRSIPYGFGTFGDHATAIPDSFRRLYRNDRTLQKRLGNDPFERPDILWTDAPTRRVGDLVPTYAMWALWLVRPDLRDAFPLTSDDSVARFYDWFRQEAYPFFSATVIVAHAKIHNSVVEMFAPPSVAGPSVEVVGDAEERRKPARLLDRLYLRALGRLPDYEARKAFQPRLTSTAGLARVVLVIACSRESRQRPEWLGRLAATTRQALGHWAVADDPLDEASPRIEPPVATRPKDLLAPRGWFVRDTDIAIEGIWSTPAAVLPCPAGAIGDLVVEGNYAAELIERMTGSPRSELTIVLDDEVVATRTLEASGPFSVRAPMTAGSKAGLSELRLECSSHFVPHDIGLNEDRRQLSWRARRVAVGDEVLLDAARVPPILSAEAINTVAGVNLVGYVTAESGVGESLRSFARSCKAVGVRCSAFDVGYQSSNRQQDESVRDLVVDDDHFQINVLHVNADQTPATLTVMAQQHRQAAINIAYWHWEQPDLPSSFLGSFEGLTEVWVPSGFVRDAVAKLSPIPVFKVPHAIDFTVDATVDRRRFGLPSDRFLVLAMYDFDSYQVRKNPQAAIEAYRRACGSRSDTALVIKTINGARNPEGRQELDDALAGMSNVHCIDDYLSRRDVYALEAACDCFISLHRSEGYGLGLAEMMYLGKPVIGTGWSGNMEFMTPMNSFPIDYELKPLEKTIGVYQAGALWAEADVEQASHVLGRIVEDAALRHEVGQRASAHMRRYYSPAEIGRQYRNRLSLITLRRP